MNCNSLICWTVDACFKSLHRCSIDVLTRYLTRW